MVESKLAGHCFLYEFKNEKEESEKVVTNILKKRKDEKIKRLAIRTLMYRTEHELVEYIFTLYILERCFLTRLISI